MKNSTRGLLRVPTQTSDAGTYGWEQSFSYRLQQQRRAELAAESAAEQYAEDAWLRHAERSDAESERDMREADADPFIQWLEAGRPGEPELDPIAFDPMTDKQRAYLASLIARAGDELYASVDFDVLTRTNASRLIDELKSFPVAAPAPVTRETLAPILPALPLVPSGRYAVELGGVLRFYRVRADAAGRFVGLSAQASDAWWPVTKYASRREVLDAIVAAEPRSAAERYGRELGKCGCCGRTLTDETSRANGLGPDCVGHFGMAGVER